jgi:hypothetical protein
LELFHLPRQLNGPRLASRPHTKKETTVRRTVLLAALALPLAAQATSSRARSASPLPKEVTDKLGAALAAIVADPAIVKRFEELGFVAKQVADWQPAIKAADLK